MVLFMPYNHSVIILDIEYETINCCKVYYNRLLNRQFGACILIIFLKVQIRQC